MQIAGSDAAIGHNPGINEAEPITSKGDKAFQGNIASPGPFTRDHSLRKTRRESAQLTTTARQRRNGRARRPTKKKNGPCGRWDSGWPCGTLVIVSLARSEPVPSSHEKQGPHSNGQCPQIFCEPSRNLSQCTQEPKDN